MRFISEDAADVRPLWMSPQEINNPSEFISQFCRMHSIADCRFFLWQMLSNSVSAKNTDANASAGEQLYFFENLMPFIEAVFLLQHTDSERIVGVSTEDKASHENIESSVLDKNSAASASTFICSTSQKIILNSIAHKQADGNASTAITISAAGASLWSS